MREHTCCFTGHREIDPAKYIYIKHRLICVIDELISAGITDFCTGGALGFDTVAAQTVLEARERHPDIKLHLVLPCKEQAEKWSYIHRETYNDIIKRADSSEYLSEQYTRYCMQLRNRALVERSSICVCCLEKAQGGTAYTVNYARQKGLKVINIME